MMRASFYSSIVAADEFDPRLVTPGAIIATLEAFGKNQATVGRLRKALSRLV